jgi:hypothetical protein
VAQNPFEGIGRELKRAMEEHGRLLNEEMKRVQVELHSAMEQMKDEMHRVGAELQRAMEEFHRQRSNPNEWDEIVIAPEPIRRSKKVKIVRGKKKPRRRPPGTAAAPVKPRPKPMPLVDGAEAPID